MEGWKGGRVESTLAFLPIKLRQAAQGHPNDLAYLGRDGLRAVPFFLLVRCYKG
jgi:hypothetical protein